MIFLTLLLVTILLSHSTFACGGFFCSQSAPVIQEGENILFSLDDGIVTATVQVQYSGDADDFSWVLPLPTVPTGFGTSSDQLFRALHAETDPRFIVELTTPKCVFKGDDEPFACPVRRQKSAQASKSVDVIATGEVGPFVYTVVAAKEGDPTGAALFAWLNDNGFDQPTASRAIIERYVGLKFKFVTLKLQKGKSTGELVPIVLEYPAPLGTLDMSCIPLRLTAIAATERMPVFAWVAGESRAVPQNFVHLEPDLAELPWHKCMSSGSKGFFARLFRPFGGNNVCNDEYRELLRQTAATFGAGRWMTTEFAGAPSDGLLDAIWSDESVDLSELRGLTEASAFLSRMFALLPSDLQRAASTQALIRTHLPQSAEAESDDECGEERAFYSLNGKCLDKFIGSQFDGAAFVDAIDAQLFEPLRAARKLIAKSAVVTRLFTEIEPEFMGRDPVFRFAPPGRLPDVSNVHRVTATFQCPESFDDAVDLVFTHPNGRTTALPGVKQSRCGGLQIPSDAVWPNAVGGRMELLNTDDNGEVRRTAIPDGASYATHDKALSGVDNNVPIAQCNPGTAYCGCAAGDVCAVGLECHENLCVSPSYETTVLGKTTAAVGATTTASSTAAFDDDGGSGAGVLVLGSGVIAGAVGFADL